MGRLGKSHKVVKGLNGNDRRTNELLHLFYSFSVKLLVNGEGIFVPKIRNIYSPLLFSLLG